MQNIDSPRSISKPWGINIFGYILIFGSIFQMLVVGSAGIEHYYYLHQEYTKDIIQLRYSVSWFIKIVGIILGIGILKLNNSARLLAIFNCLFIVCTVHLKHTYVAYSRHTANLDTLGFPFETSFSSITWPALIIQRLIDIIFGLWFIWYFTRPHIITYFKK